MIRRPKVGMKVRIIGGMEKTRITQGGNVICNYDGSRCDTGTIVEIDDFGKRAHHEKGYTIEFDPPNFGQWLTLGTKEIEEIREEKK